eukprot:TRINITY_DN5001_c0_g1_i1.p1 TRINITY_DN5001_c0_g1~~TRINITY_DN5001_c0_g1_i1.p1  ORF type:complete len:313 (-),score=89.39 TRINITY_DN5001_c0_g1_i1:254-1192(-)
MFSVDSRNKWFAESINDDLQIFSSLKTIYYTGKSQFQTIDVVETGAFGRCLLIDGKMQSASIDEVMYHESLVHPVMLAHPNPKTVFVGGGGEGATIRELFRHKSVEKVVMADIDEVVVKVSRDHLPSHHAGAYENPKLELHIDDAKKILLEYPHNFDVVIFDLADPTEGGPAYMLYTKNFYEQVKAKLNPGGLVITQSGPAGLLTYKEPFPCIRNTLGAVFGTVFEMALHIPSFNDMYSYVIATDSKVDIRSWTGEHVNRELKNRLGEEAFEKLSYYDGMSHQTLVNIPKYLRNAIKEEQRIYTEENPVYFH